MSVTMTATSLGTSNMRGSSRQTRINPVRNSRSSRPNLRQNSLISNPASLQGASPAEPHGFYPAITHFSDAITALPRDFRRHTSLLKEVDAKAWALEENLQKLLTQCLQERETRPTNSTAQTVAGSASSVAGDVTTASAADSVNGVLLDNASQNSVSNFEVDVMRRRQLYAALRNNLVQMMMPMDEKNHVINNANEDISRHIRRQDDIWPHIAEEISEDTRLGSLKHWALTDLNPTKKTQAAVSRGREAAAASLAIMHDNDIAERSERRREALLAKKLKVKEHADSDMDDRTGKRGAATSKNKRIGELVGDIATGKGKGKKIEKPPAMGIAMEKQNSKTGFGGTPMSRESSQQDNTKKRKAPTSASTVARKRLNANTQESPKLASSPLAGNFGKDAYKQSPTLSSVRPASGRGRQNSSQTVDGVKSSSSRTRPMGNAKGAMNQEDYEYIAGMSGKSAAEVRQDIEAMGDTGLNASDNVSMSGTRRGAAMERSASKQSHLKRETSLLNDTQRRGTASPRMTPSAMADNRNEKGNKSRVGKTSTPTVGTFAEAEANESADGMSFNENGYDGNGSKAKRPARPRMKDHHGLHDSLSPKGLPTKRMHKKNNSYSFTAQQSSFRNREDDTASDRKGSTSMRTNSRSNKQPNANDVKDHRASSSTPRIGMSNSQSDVVDEPESFLDDGPKGHNGGSFSGNGNVGLGVSVGNSKTRSSTLNDKVNDMEDDNDVGEPDDEDDEEEEQRYCYCNGVSYGQMVACDNENCPKEWFHLECIGLQKLPTAKKWYCELCRPKFGGK